MPNMTAPSNNIPRADASLERVIRYVESSNDPHALRFEPGTYENLGALSSAQIALLDKIAHFNKCDFATAKVIYSSSFGYYQMMGFNIYSLGFGDNIFSFCDSDAYQEDIFTDFLDSRAINLPWSELKADQTKLLNFARVYNGPGDPQAYAARMRSVATELGL